MSKKSKAKATKKGQPRRIQSKDHLIEWLTEFLDYVIDNGFQISPSKTQFIRWMYNIKHYSSSRSALQNSLRLYYPEAADEYNELISDVLAEGGLTGKYSATMTKYILQNWCKWNDDTAKTETESEEKTNDKSINEFVVTVRYPEFTGNSSETSDSTAIGTSEVINGAVGNIENKH